MSGAGRVERPVHSPSGESIMAKSEDVQVTVTTSHTYRTGPSTTRTLPAGWSGDVPVAVADEIEAAGTGRRDKTGEAESGEAETGTTEPMAERRTARPKTAKGGA
ncbi:hypothetical protein ATO8_21246 [Roseivivax marinus]|uniref:Uncharacterized protein n=2 Tax=Roseivivax marinus TaxID=1379903 RepID=W4HEQ6_9RHOB|nr:hypothetical protein ATO8_21246 [Roseivivax marinus]